MAWTRQVADNASLLEQADCDSASIDRSMKTFRLIDGSDIKLMDVGAGEPIILVNTVRDLNFVFAPLLEEFSRDYRVILYEPRLLRDRLFSIVDRKNELALVAQSLSIPRFHMVSLSDAGSGAYLYAKEMPHSVCSVTFLVLADRYRLPLGLDLLATLLYSYPIEDLVPALISSAFLSMFIGGREAKRSWVAERAREIPGITRLMKYSLMPCMFEHRPLYGEVNVPALIVSGDNVPLVSVKQALRMSKLLPKAVDPVIIPNGEHLLAYSCHKVVNQAIRRFLSNL